MTIATITTFHRAQSIQGRRYQCEWSRLFDRLAVPREARSKLELPLWSPATFPRDSRPEGAVPIEVCALVLDVDHGATLSGGLGAIASGPMACLHTSWQHRRDVERKVKQPDGTVKVEVVREDRFRLVFPLSEPVAGARYATVWSAAERWLREVHGIAIDTQTKNSGRSWFVPARAPGASFESFRNDGPFLDPWRLAEKWAPVRAAPPPPPPPRDRSSDHDRQLRRASAWLQRMPESISGSSGHKALWDAALALVKGFELEPHEAQAMLLSEFNPRCAPPWREKDIAHKVRQAATSSTPSGFIGHRARR